ncbi:hypothetical protein ACJWDR_00220 [Streptomyces tauricus]|uniref:hypothetical protein n=1 Tax=Streptomyces tauricus TaxID=68274 RepID=UPI00387F1D38
MPDILTAVDETAANVILSREISSLQPPPVSRTSTFGPFSIAWAVSTSFTSGTVDIIPPPTDVIRLSGVRLNYSANLKVTLDLGFLDFCLPRVCLTIPFVGRICTPRICLHFPTIEVPVSHASTVDFTADVRPSVTLAGDVWKVEAVIVGVPQLVLGPAATALLGTVGAAVTAALLLVPAIGPLLALASAVIFGALTVANLLGVLGALLTPLVAGLRIPLHKAPRLFEILPASGQDSAVFVRIDSVVATLDGSGGEDELILAIDISP